MSFTETITTSLGSRLGGSCSGMVLGLMLLAAGTWLLWWNEGDFVAAQDALEEAQAVTVEMTAPSTVDPTLHGKLVHAVGRADTQDVLSDSIFGVQDTAIALKRTVEFYQWTEHSRSEKRQKLGGEEETVTAYSYTKDWVHTPVASSRFRAPDASAQYANTVLMHVERQTQYAPHVTFGAYRLPDFFVRAISGAAPLQVALPDDVVKTLETQIYSQYPQLRGADAPAPGAIPAEAGMREPARAEGVGALVHPQGNTIYIGKSSLNPAVGDVRVTFHVVRPAVVSIIARVNGDTFEKYYAPTGKSLARLRMGAHSMQEMFAVAHESNSVTTWALRILGIIIVISGLKIVLAPLGVLFSFLPFLGSIVSAGASLVASLLGLGWSLIVISLAWLLFRPLVGGGLLAVAALLIALGLFIKKKIRLPVPASDSAGHGA